jgi:hypothetical protein
LAVTKGILKTEKREGNTESNKEQSEEREKGRERKRETSCKIKESQFVRGDKDIK